MKPAVVSLLALVFASSLATAQEPPTITIRRTTGRIVIDGDLSDPGWKGAARVETWYETNPGDNVTPSVRNVAYLAYDDRFLYAAFEFADPDPSQIRAPLGDRDNVPPYTDYGGIILDTRNDSRTGLLLLANARGIQYDAVADDATGNEDSSPDFYWDSAARITKDGWVLEMRVPFSSLRYPRADPQTWGILLYRNYPRAYRYQMFSARIPRGSNCFVCRSNKLVGLSGLPQGAHFVVAPYVSASETGQPREGLGTPLLNQPIQATGGVDAKWTPSADSAIDLTAHPDFSQVESDVAQISANERFALFYPEKRPFFLEGTELLSTPIQAAYTRTITAPRWGSRATGKFGATAYTVLVAEDGGGGSVILPGPNSSEVAPQDFRSLAAIARVRRDIGSSFVSVLTTARQIQGGGHNIVFGPDFQWRTGHDMVTGQLLFSDTRNPDRPDLSAGWQGQSLSSYAASAMWLHSTNTVDWVVQQNRYGRDFRADNGFVPQVGFQETYAEAGYTFRPTGFLRRLRTFLITDYSTEIGSGLLNRQVSPGMGMDGRWSSFMRFRYAAGRVRAGDGTLPRQQFIYTVQFSPTRAISQISFDGFVGQEIDFANARVGTGATVNLGAAVRPADRLELRLTSGRRWLNVDAGSGLRGRLFTAQVSRLRATYTFTPKAYLRGIAQYISTTRDPLLYLDTMAGRDGDFSGSALFAYKLSWQTVLFFGYGDNRLLSDENRLERSERQFFLKVSYAFQR